MQKWENLEHKRVLQILKRWYQCLLVFVSAILTWEMFRQLWLKDSNNVSNRYGHKDVWWLSDKLCMCVLLHSIWYFSTQKEDNFQLTRRRRRWRGCGHFPLSCWKLWRATVLYVSLCRMWMGSKRILTTVTVLLGTISYWDGKEWLNSFTISYIP